MASFPSCPKRKISQFHTPWIRPFWYLNEFQMWFTELSLRDTILIVRKRLVFHINRLKLCHPETVDVGTGINKTYYHREMSSKEDNDMESISGCTRRHDELIDDEDVTTVIISQQEHHDGAFSQPALEESQRGGEVWGGRLSVCFHISIEDRFFKRGDSVSEKT